MYTVETALETLKRFDIDEANLAQWERELGLEIPVDIYGRKEYSPHHINLFKNVKKHLALGRTLNEIRQLVTLPPMEDSKPNTDAAPLAKTADRLASKSPYASTPSRPTIARQQAPAAPSAGGAASVVQLVNKLTVEKDQLFKKLLETEKLNSHLYSANGMFHRKVKEQTETINELQSQLKTNENFKLLDDKAKLHKELIDAERASQAKESELQNRKLEISRLEGEIQSLQNRIASLTHGFDPAHFRGDWMENGQLIDVVYDNFGINIESERVRLFRISELPEHVYGSSAIINTTYQYETNKLWKRQETLYVAWIDDNTLQGEVVAEYIMDNVPVAKAVYRVTCTRHQ